MKEVVDLNVKGAMVRIEPDKVNGLAKLSTANTFQVRSVAQERFVRQVGELSKTYIQAIAQALSVVLAIKPGCAIDD